MTLLEGGVDKLLVFAHHIAVLDRVEEACAGTQYTHFTCCTTLVQKYKYCVDKLLVFAHHIFVLDRVEEACAGTQFSCFTSTKVQILTQSLHATSLCWIELKRRALVLSLLALLVQKYKY